MRSRSAIIAGRVVSAEEAQRFEVVRGVLTGSLTLVQGANLLGMPMLELARLVNGARAAVIRELGEQALETARVQLAG